MSPDDPEQLASFLQKLARSSYRLDKAMADPVNLSLSVILSVIQTMEKEIAKLDKEIEKIMKSIPETLSSVKGLGQFLLPVLLPKSAISPVFLITILSLSTPDLFGPNISPENLKVKKPSEYAQAINIYAII